MLHLRTFDPAMMLLKLRFLVLFDPGLILQLEMLLILKLRALIHLLEMRLILITLNPRLIIQFVMLMPPRLNTLQLILLRELRLFISALKMLLVHLGQIMLFLELQDLGTALIFGLSLEPQVMPFLKRPGLIILDAP